MESRAGSGDHGETSETDDRPATTGGLYPQEGNHTSGDNHGTSPNAAADGTFLGGNQTFQNWVSVPSSSQGQLRTFTQVLNPDQGKELSFHEFDENEDAILLDKKDIEPMFDHWRNAVACFFLGAHPPFKVLEGHLKKIWKYRGIKNIIGGEEGIAIVLFEEYEHKLRVIREGTRFVDRKPLIVKEWNLNEPIDKNSITRIPTWVRLPKLHPKYWSSSSLGKIGSLLGRPIRADSYTTNRTRLAYARILIDIDFSKPLKEEVELKEEDVIN